VNNKTKAHLALLGTNLFYGAGYTVSKSIMPRLLEPFAFIFIRVLIVMILFWLSFGWGKKYRAKIAKKDWPILMLGGLFGVALNMMMFFVGLNLTFPIHASLIMLSTPLLITLISIFVLKARMGWDKWLGMLLGVGGAVLLMSAGKEMTMTGNSALGDLFIFLNAASYAIYLVIIKPLMLRYRPIVVIRWVFFFGFLYILPFSWTQFAAINWGLFTAPDYLALGFVVVCVTFFTYLWNTYALSHLEPSVAGAYIYLQPIFAAIISVLVTDEELTWVKLVSTLLIFSGVYLVNFGIRKKELNH
jgi:drug/metabolite transporter (DMT)-like permease